MDYVDKRKATKQWAKTTLAEVIKEMAKPRVANSARQQGFVCRNDILVAKKNVEK
jgi:hypothetical protein